MTDPNGRSNEGLAALSDVTPAMIAAVEHDAARNSQSTMDIQRELIEVNDQVPIKILSNAHAEAQGGTDAETAYIKGAYFILGLLDRPAKVALLRAMMTTQAPDESVGVSKIPTPRSH